LNRIPKSDDGKAISTESTPDTSRCRAKTYGPIMLRINPWTLL